MNMVMSESNASSPDTCVRDPQLQALHAFMSEMIALLH